MVIRLSQLTPECNFPKETCRKKRTHIKTRVEVSPEVELFLYTMLVKRNATLNQEFFVAPLNEGLNFEHSSTHSRQLHHYSTPSSLVLQPPSKLIFLFQGAHKKIMDQSCVSFDQHCTIVQCTKQGNKQDFTV